MIDWEEIDTVFFDMDGTLLDLFFDNHFWNVLIPEEFSANKNLHIDEGRKLVFTLLAAEEGKLSWYKLDYLSEILELDVVEMKLRHKERISLYPASKDVLEQLKKKGKNIIMVSDADPKVLSIKLEETELAPYFDKIVSSHYFDASKQEQAFWERFSEEYCFNKNRCLFIDDNQKVLKAAKDFGIKHLLAISKPDSSLPERDVSGFNKIKNIKDLLTLC